MLRDRTIVSDDSSSQTNTFMVRSVNAGVIWLNRFPMQPKVTHMYTIRIELFRLLLVVFAMTLVSGCSRSTTSLSTGMKMQDAVSEMKKLGIEPQKMAYSGAHNAFDLKDGRTVVLMGDQTVDEIELILNPDHAVAQYWWTPAEFR